MVPFGDFHISFRPNSFTRASSGVMVAHLTPTPTFLMALAASIVTWSLVCVAVFHSEVKIHQLDIEERGDQLVLDVLPDDPGHLVAIEFDDGVGHLDFCHDGRGLFSENRACWAGWSDYRRAIALQTGRRKPSRYAVSAHLLGRNALRLERRRGNGAGHHATGHARQAGPRAAPAWPIVPSRKALIERSEILPGPIILLEKISQAGDRVMPSEASNPKSSEVESEGELRNVRSGTDKTKAGLDLAGPVVILVEPQLGENIGMAARAMGNFALSRLRIVNPRDGWPNIAAQRAAAGADQILEQAQLFDTVEQAVADLTLLFATTARAHDQAKPVVGPDGPPPRSSPMSGPAAGPASCSAGSATACRTRRSRSPTGSSPFRSIRVSPR